MEGHVVGPELLRSSARPMDEIHKFESDKSLILKQDG